MTLRLVVLWVPLYAALVWIWPWAEDWFSAGLRWSTANLWNELAPGREVRFREVPEGMSKADLALILRPRDAAEPLGGFFVGTFQTAYQPLAVFLALVLATKASARHKAWGTALGLALLLAFIVVRVLGAIGIHYAQLAALENLATANQILQRSLQGLLVVFWREPVTNYVVGLLVCALTLWRPHQRDALARRGRPAHP